MNEYKKYFPTILASLAIAFVLKLEIEAFIEKDWFVFDVFIMLFWYLLSLLIAVWAITISRKKLKVEESKIYKLPYYILALGVVAIVGLKIIEHIKNSSPIILKAYYDGDTNGLGLDLREDGTYRIENSSILGGNYIDGNYRFKGDTILLDKERPLGSDNDFLTNKLLVTPDKVLFHLNKDGKFDSGYFSMDIIESKIKK